MQGAARLRATRHQQLPPTRPLRRKPQARQRGRQRVCRYWAVRRCMGARLAIRTFPATFTTVSKPVGTWPAVLQQALQVQEEPVAGSGSGEVLMAAVVLIAARNVRMRLQARMATGPMAVMWCLVREVHRLQLLQGTAVKSAGRSAPSTFSSGTRLPPMSSKVYR